MHADLDVTLAELGDCLIEVLDAVHEDWLVAGEMAREQEWGRVWSQAGHRHPGAEGLNREYEFRSQSIGEVLQVGGDVSTR